MKDIAREILAIQSNSLNRSRDSWLVQLAKRLHLSFLMGNHEVDHLLTLELVEATLSFAGYASDNHGKNDTSIVEGSLFGESRAALAAQCANVFDRLCARALFLAISIEQKDKSSAYPHGNSLFQVGMRHITVNFTTLHCRIVAK